MPAVRRWWTDAAPEFAKAGRTIPAQRRLAPYQSLPYRLQANGRAENFNRFLIEGTRCLLLQLGLGERWWPLAIVLFCMNYTALYRGSEGKTQWIRRFNEPHEFQPYPFGALVFYVHPSASPYPGSKSQDGHSTKKWRSRLVPIIFVGITIGPGCKWDRS